MGILKEDGIGGDNNCNRQIINNTILKLFEWLTDMGMGYFWEVNLILLLIGHTQILIDRLLNATGQFNGCEVLITKEA